jgi:hypothetical protein
MVSWKKTMRMRQSLRHAPGTRMGKRRMWTRTPGRWAPFFSLRAVLFLVARMASSPLFSLFYDPSPEVDGYCWPYPV